MSEPNKANSSRESAGESRYQGAEPLIVETPEGIYSITVVPSEASRSGDSTAVEMPKAEPRRGARRHYTLIAAAWMILLLALPQVDPRALGTLGLASALPLRYYIALIALVVGFVLALVHHPTRAVLASYVASVAVFLHGLSPLVYENLRFSWAWKHIGIVDFIQRTGSVDRNIETLSAYHNWPGFFSLGALASDLSGVDSALVFAPWAPVFFNLAYLLALYVVFRGFTSDKRLIATGLLIFTIGNWVGQDYFAPQAVAFLFYLIIVAILLHWFDAGHHNKGSLTSNSERTLIGAVLVLMFIAVVITHQLTPVMTIAMLGSLTLIGGLRARWPLVAAVVIMGVWFASFAQPFVADYLPRVIADLGNIGGRVDDGLIDYNQVDTSQRFVSLAARGTTAGISLLAGLGFWRSFRKAANWRLAALLAAVPLLMVAASSYGDEVVFRAFLFALPMLSLFAAALWFPSPGRVLGRVGIVSLMLILTGLSFGGLVAMHGNDIYTVFSDDEVAAAETMYTIAAPGSGVIQLTNSYPTKFRNYEALEELNVASFSQQAKDRFLGDSARWFAQWLEEGEYAEGYVLITRSQREEVKRIGLLPADGLETIEDSLRESDDFALLVDSEDAVLFRLVREAAT